MKSIIYLFSKYEFHVFKKGLYIYLCISEVDFPKRQSYVYLN